MNLKHGRLLEVKRDTYNGKPSNSIKVGERFRSESGDTIETGVYIDLPRTLTGQELTAWDSFLGDIVTVSYKENPKISAAGRAYISRWDASLVDVAQLMPLELA